MACEDESNIPMKYFERRPLRFQCTQCGGCCKGGTDHYVHLLAKEAERIRKYLGLTENWFRRRYLRCLNDELILVSEPGGNCVFLQTDGHCRVYRARPLQCKTYPFWPENLSSRRSWERESHRCEGIGRGHEIPVELIRITLQRQINSDK